MIGAAEDRREDLYLSRDSGPADGTTHDLIAVARNALPLLIEEVRHLRSKLEEPKAERRRRKTLVNMRRKDT